MHSIAAMDREFPSALARAREGTIPSHSAAWVVRIPRLPNELPPTLPVLYHSARHGLDFKHLRVLARRVGTLCTDFWHFEPSRFDRRTQHLNQR